MLLENVVSTGLEIVNFIVGSVVIHIELVRVLSSFSDNPGALLWLHSSLSAYQASEGCKCTSVVADLAEGSLLSSPSYEV